MSIRLSRCSVGPREREAAAAVLESSFLGMGKETQAFETELATYFGGGREVIAVNTGTSAVHLAVQACGLKPGDEILVPTLTFVASFQAISAAGCVPVACDVRLADGCLDPADAARRITPRTRAIMPVHYASATGALDELYALARTHGLRVIEDAAHALGTTHGGQRIGGFGDTACFSFDGIKNITCAEGGAIVTGDPETARRARDARLLGVEKDTEKRYSGQRSWEFDVTEQGWRYHLSNLNAAIGRVQLSRLETEFSPRRRALASRYASALASLPGIVLFPADYDCVTPHIFPVRILADRRDAVRESLTARGIETGIHYKPNHLLSLYGGGKTSLPVAEQLYGQLLSLPLHVELTDAEQDAVITALAEILV